MTTSKRADDIISHDTGHSLTASDEDEQETLDRFVAELPPEAQRYLIHAILQEGVGASFYLEVLSHRPIMWLRTPCQLMTRRYFPEEWVWLVRAAIATNNDLSTPQLWQQLAGWGRYGH